MFAAYIYTHRHDEASFRQASPFAKFAASAHHAPDHGMQHTSRWQTVEQTTNAMALHHCGEGSVGTLLGLFTDGSLGKGEGKPCGSECFFRAQFYE